MTHEELIADELCRVRIVFADPNNWCQGDAYRGQASCLWAEVGGYCIDSLYRSLPFWFRLKCRLVGPKYAGAVITFNDLPSTTHDDILKLLDKAICIAALRAQSA